MWQRIVSVPSVQGHLFCCLDCTRYKKLYLKSAFNFNASNISHQEYFIDKQSERQYKYKRITNHRKFGLISQKFTLYRRDIYKLRSCVRKNLIKIKFY